MYFVQTVTYFILSFVYVDVVAAGISKYGKAALDNYKGVTTWYTPQENIHCCGATGVKDWKDLLKNLLQGSYLNNP